MFTIIEQCLDIYKEFAKQRKILTIELRVDYQWHRGVVMK